MKKILKDAYEAAMEWSMTRAYYRLSLSLTVLIGIYSGFEFGQGEKWHGLFMLALTGLNLWSLITIKESSVNIARSEGFIEGIEATLEGQRRWSGR